MAKETHARTGSTFDANYIAGIYSPGAPSLTRETLASEGTLINSVSFLGSWFGIAILQESVRKEAAPDYALLSVEGCLAGLTRMRGRALVLRWPRPWIREVIPTELATDAHHGACGQSQPQRGRRG